MSTVKTAMDSLVAALQSIAALQAPGRVQTPNDEDDLMDKVKGIPLPVVGVLYEGMRRRAEAKPSHKMGLATDLGFSLVLFTYGKAPDGENTLPAALDLLDLMRNKIKDTTAPGGHTWQFVVEAQVAVKNGVLVWVQRWQTPQMLS